MADRQTKVTLIAAVNGYITDMQRAQAATGKVGDEAAKAAKKLEEQRQAMSDVGAGVAAIGAVAAVAFGLAVAKFAEFDQAMSNVKAATQESAENMTLLRDAALEAGASTVFSATEAANAIEELGKAGLSTEQILNGGLAGALDLAAAGQLDVAEAAGYAAIALKQFELAGEDIPHVADLLAAGAGKAVGDVKDLADALNQTGLVANGAGQSIEDTTGVLAAFADAGMLGSDAGTSLKQAILKLQAPTDKARDIMEAYNLAFYDTNGQMLSFDKIAGQLKTNMSELSDETRDAALAQIFGSDAVRAANVLYREGSEGIRKYIDQTNDSGYAAKVAADRLDNLTGDVEKLGGAIDTALIKSGSGVNDMLRGVTQAATGIVDAISSLPTPVLGLGTQLIGIVGAIGLVGGAALLAVPKIVQFRTALRTLEISGASAARGIGLASGALAIAGTAFAVWAQRQAEATATAAEFQDSLDQSTGAITDYTRELVAKKLAEANAFEGAAAAGISQRELTDAILEGGDAVYELRQRLYDYANGNPFDGNIANSVNAVNRLSDGLEESAEDFKDQAAAARESSDQTEDAATSYQTAADNAAELEGNLRKLIDTINEANGGAQDAVSANSAYQDSIAGIAEEVKRQQDEFLEPQKKAYEEIHGNLEGFVGDLSEFVLSLDQSTASGAANAAMLADVAGKAQDAADAQYEVDRQTMLAEDATKKYYDTLVAQKTAFEEAATAAGFNADEVKALSDQVFALPSEKEIEILTNTAEASGQIAQFIADAERRVIQIGVTTVRKDGDGLVYTRDGRTFYEADGGHVKFYANGGREDHIAQYARPGTWRVWAEPETGGEWYLPDSPAKRNRSVAIAQQMLSGWGYQMVPSGFRNFADGGELRYASNMPVFMGGSGSAGAPVINVDVRPDSGLNAEQVGRIAAEKTAFQLRRS